MSDDGTRAVPPPVMPPGEDARARVFPCEGCGADLTFDIGVQSLKCPFCGFEKALDDPRQAIAEQDLDAALEKEAERRAERRDWVEGVREVRCGDCGATVRFLGTLTATHCAYCGTPIQLAGVHDAARRIPVDGVLPFLVSHDRARAGLDQWARSRWFAPGDFVAAVKGRFQGVYMPYWTFDALTMNRYEGERGDHYWVTVRVGNQDKRVRKTRWRSASGAFRRFFDDVLVVAGAGLPSDVVKSLEPWPLAQCRPFDPALAAGFVARTYDVELAEGFRSAKRRIAAAIDEEVRERIGGDEQRVHSIDTSFGAVTYKHLLLPIWLLAYRYRDRVYQVIVNAATGEVQGQRPWSWWKIAGVIVLGVAVVAAVFLVVGR